MKQEIISYLSTLEDEIRNLSRYLYDNPEDNFCEYKSYNFITKLLTKYDFKIHHNYLDIDTAFLAQYGDGHPKICYICKYSASSNSSHVYGNNLNCSMAVGAAISLSKVLHKTKGSIIVLGCPGNDFNGAELTITKQGCFEDMDVILAPNADIDNFQSGTSMAVVPMHIKFKSKNNSFENTYDFYSPLDACIFTFNTITLLAKNLRIKCYIDGLSINGANNTYMYPCEGEIKFYIRANDEKHVEVLEKKIKDFVKAIAPILDVESEVSLFQVPSEPLITNKELSRLFTHNLKEAGIIDIKCCKDTPYGLSIGSVSHTTPCIYPSISIVEDNLIKYPSKEFGEATISDYAHDKVMKAIQALALTGYDIIDKETLLTEMTVELSTKNNF